MKDCFAILSSLLLLFSCACVAKTASMQVDFTGKDYNFHHYQLNLIDENLSVKKDNQTILTKPTLTKDIKNFTVNNITKTNHGFKLSANWGGGEYLYKTQFYFSFDKVKDDFYLVKIDECMLDNAKDEKKSYTTFRQQAINSPINLAKFDFATDYNHFQVTQPQPKIAKCYPF